MKALKRSAVMRKGEDLRLDEISQLLEAAAREKGVTRAVLGRAIERIRARLWKGRHAKAARAA